MSARCWPEFAGIELTPAELRCLQAAAAGVIESDATAVLGWSMEAYKAQLVAVRRKLRAKNTAHAVANGFRAGLLE